MKKKSTLFFLFLSLLFISSFFKSELRAQTAMVTIDYNGYTNYCCAANATSYYCFNSPGGSGYCGGPTLCNTQSFIDPVPAGNIVTSITINYYTAGCGAGQMAGTLNGNVFPTAFENNTGCLCSSATWQITGASTSTYPCGISGYNYGASNTFQMCASGGQVCIDRTEITMTYKPSNQAVPATQPGAIVGSSNFCAGVPQVFSISPVSNATSYTWSVPAGWVINSGQGTTSINATPGSAGNICVTASNLCGTSAPTCLPVNLNTPSNAPSSAAASPPFVCGSGSSNLTVSGGSVGTGAVWEWYSGSCGGTLVGTGSSISVSASSTTTYFVRAVGSCNTTACASVILNVNPIPTANAGSTSVLTCNTTSTILNGSGGGSYSWTGPGIVSGNTTANPTVNQPGTYSLIVTSSGCQSPVSTVNITQNITPPSATAATASGSVLNCNITSLSLNGTPSSGVNYSWTGPGIVSGANTASPIVNQPGNYFLTVTNTSNGCSNSSSPASVSITQNTIAINGAANTGSAITCTSSAVNLSSSPAGYTYTWTAPSGSSITSGTNTQNANGLGGGTYTVTIKDNATGCFTNATVLIPQNTTSPTGVSAASGGTITCSVSTVTLSSTPSTGVTYSWSGSGIVSGATTANPVVNQAGNYSLTVTSNSNGCSNSTSPAVVTVAQNGALPTANASVSGSLTCSTTTLTLTGTSTGATTYSWSGPGIVSGGSSTNPIVNQPGTYIFTATNGISGCSNTSAVTVAQNNSIPNPSISAAGNNTLTCLITVVTLTVNPSTGVNYSWSGPGIVSGANTANPSVNQPGNYTVTITDIASGCSNNSPAIVTVFQNTVSPTITLTTAAASASITCAITTVTLNTLPTSGVSYNWSGPGIVSGNTTSSPIVNQPGNYSVTVTNTVNGCSNSIGSNGSVISVPIDTITPIAQINTTTTGSITCTNTVVVINGGASSTGPNYSYTWSTTTGTLSGNSNTSSPSVNGPGSYTLTVLNTTNGCTNTATVTIISNVNLPTGVNAGANSILPCTSGSITLNGTSTSTNVTYQWNGPNNYTFTGQNATNVNSSGIYTLTVIDNVTGCTSSDTMIVVDQGVHASFTADPSTGIAPLLVNFTNTSTGANSYTWNFNDGNTSNITNPTNTFQSNGTYTVILIAQNTNGNCSDTATTIIIVEADFTIMIPNVFTPNNDGKNDNFMIKCTGVKDLSCEIYNRWGEKVFTINNPNQLWDGTLSTGTLATDGTYLFILTATPTRGEIFKKQGSINLFR